MTNCIKSEFYRVFHTKAVYFLTGACLLAVLLFNVVLWVMATLDEGFPWATTKYAFSTLEVDMHIPLFLSAVMGSVIVADELKHRTINNSVAFGHPREQIFLSKVIVGLAADHGSRACSGELAGHEVRVLRKADILVAVCHGIL